MSHSSAATLKKKRGWGLTDSPGGQIMACGARVSKGPLPDETQLRGIHRDPIYPPFLAPAHWEDTGQQCATAKPRTALGSLGAGRKEGEGLRELPVEWQHFQWSLPGPQGPIPSSCPHTQSPPACSKSYPAIPLLGIYPEKTLI